MIKNLLYRFAGIKPLSEEEIKQSLSQSQKKDIYDDVIFSFNFLINKNGQLFIEGKWLEQSQQMAEFIAKFLFLLNKGQITPYINNYFQGIIKNSDLSQQKFIKEIISELNKLIKDDEKEEDLPIVRPSNAFVFNKIKLDQNANTESDE
jgi:hypothetical protein